MDKYFRKVLNSAIPFSVIVGLFIPIYYKETKNWGYTIAFGRGGLRRDIPVGWIMIIVAIIF